MNGELDVGKVNLAGKGGRDPFPTGTTDIPPGILTVVYSLFEVIAITAAHTAFAACISITLHQTTIKCTSSNFPNIIHLW